MKITKLLDGVAIVKVDARQMWMLQISDVHYDSTKCDRELLTRHLKQAEERNAFVMINGDFFDVMQGKYDPRRTYDNIRPEYKGGNYLDLVVNDAVEYLSKFNLTYFIAEGNHESNIRERQGTDLIDRLVMGVKMNGGDIERGLYKGWIVYSLTGGGNGVKYTQHYHHGYGGNAPRSKGVLKVDLNMKAYPDADLLTRGHDHNKWSMPQTVERLRGKGMKMYRVKQRVDNLQTGSYKKLGDAGWAVEKGFQEPVLGGWWVYLSVYQAPRPKDKERRSLQVRAEITEAR